MSTQRPVKSSFCLRGSDNICGRFQLKAQIDASDRLPIQRRPVECITCKLSSCVVPKASVSSAALTPKSSPKKKKAIKDSDLVKVPHSPRYLLQCGNPHLQSTSACTYIAVNCYDFIFFYDLQRSTNDAINTCEFFQPPLCHEINPNTSAPDHVDLCIGFGSGDIAVWNPLQRKMTGRHNRDRVIDPSSVTCVRWLPFDANLLAVGHESGAMYVYDQRLGDEAPLPKDTIEPFSVLFNPKAKCNPTQKWLIAIKALTDIVFSPSYRYCAIPSRDSHCHIIEWEDRSLRLKIRSHFGAVLCAAWSPDEGYIVTGGEDDMVFIYDLANECIVARCAGHQSWVTAVAFDPLLSQRPNGTLNASASDTRSESSGLERHRLLSVGQDCRLLFWEFEPVLMEEVPLVSVDRNSAGPDARSEVARSSQPMNDNCVCPLVHNVGKHIPVLDPISMHRLHQEPLCSLVVGKDSLMTACASAVVKYWQLTEGT